MKRLPLQHCLIFTNNPIVLPTSLRTVCSTYHFFIFHTIRVSYKPHNGKYYKCKIESAPRRIIRLQEFHPALQVLPKHITQRWITPLYLDYSMTQRPLKYCRGFAVNILIPTVSLISSVYSLFFVYIDLCIISEHFLESQK